MFSTVRYFIKTSIAFFFVGVLTGFYMMFMQQVLKVGYGYSLVSAHTHLILVGSIMMMIIGVALWFFPRPEKDDPKYNPDLIRVTYHIVTASTILRFISELALAYIELPILRFGEILGSFGQIVAMLLFFYSIWGRIRPIGSAAREAKGEKF